MTRIADELASTEASTYGSALARRQATEAQWSHRLHIGVEDCGRRAQDSKRADTHALFSVTIDAQA